MSVPERNRDMEVVRVGYNAIAARYLHWLRLFEDRPRAEFTEALDRHLDSGSRIVDLGCGAGVPSTAKLAERHSVHGVDISAEQIRLARRYVPAATFEVANVVELDLPEGSFDAVTAFYSLIHVPRTELAGLFRRIRGWLRGDGMLLVTLSAARGPDDAGYLDFLGAPMYSSGFDAERNVRLVVEAGFSPLTCQIRRTQQPEGPAEFLWVLARATNGRAPASAAPIEHPRR